MSHRRNIHDTTPATLPSLSSLSFENVMTIDGRLIQKKQRLFTKKQEEERGKRLSTPRPLSETDQFKLELIGAKVPKKKECGAGGPEGIDCNDDGYLLSIPVGYDRTHWFPKQMPLENVEVLKLVGTPEIKLHLIQKHPFAQRALNPSVSFCRYETGKKSYSEVPLRFFEKGTDGLMYKFAAIKRAANDKSNPNNMDAFAFTLELLNSDYFFIAENAFAFVSVINDEVSADTHGLPWLNTHAHKPYIYLDLVCADANTSTRRVIYRILKWIQDMNSTPEAGIIERLVLSSLWHAIPFYYNKILERTPDFSGVSFLNRDTFADVYIQTPGTQRPN
jgi:hypothetical protein